MTVPGSSIWWRTIMASCPNYYEILGVSPNATLDEIKQAYRGKVMQCHPDRGGSHEEMVAVNEAWEVLSDSQLRAEYDRVFNRQSTPREEAKWGESAQKVRERAQNYPKDWSKFETWLNDFTETEYGTTEVGGGGFPFRSRFPTATTVSGNLFIAFGVLIGVVLSLGLLTLFCRFPLTEPGKIVAWVKMHEFGYYLLFGGMLVLGPICFGARLGTGLHRAIQSLARCIQERGMPDKSQKPDGDSITLSVISCRNCGQKLRISHIDKTITIRCPKCGCQFTRDPHSGEWLPAAFGLVGLLLVCTGIVVFVILIPKPRVHTLLDTEEQRQADTRFRIIQQDKLPGTLSHDDAMKAWLESINKRSFGALEEYEAIKNMPPGETQEIAWVGWYQAYLGRRPPTPWPGTIPVGRTSSPQAPSPQTVPRVPIAKSWGTPEDFAAFAQFHADWLNSSIKKSSDETIRYSYRLIGTDVLKTNSVIHPTVYEAIFHLEVVGVSNDVVAAALDERYHFAYENSQYVLVSSWSKCTKNIVKPEMASGIEQAKPIDEAERTRWHMLQVSWRSGQPPAPAPAH